MLSHYDEWVSRAVARWITAVDRRPGLVTLLAGLATAVLGFYAARNLGVNADPNAMIANDVPFVLLDQKLDRTFQTYNEAILVAVDAESPITAGRAVDALVDRLAERSELFPEVTVLGGGEFFERNVLLYLDTERLEDLADRLARLQPFLSGVATDQSLVGITDLLRDAVTAQQDGTDLGLDLPAALDRVSVAVEAAAAARAAPDPWSDALIGGSLSEEGRHRVVALKPTLDFGELLNAGPAIQAIRQAARDLGLDADHGIRVRITGDPVLNYDELVVLKRQGQLAGAVSLVLFTVVAFWALRSVRVVLAMVGSLVVCLLWTNAFAAAAVGHLNQISVAFNVLIIGLGGEFGIHFCMHYAELAAAGRSRAEALAETGATIGSSLVSSAGTTAIGFFVFVPTDYRGVAELGLIAGVGIFVSLFCTLTVLPALLSLGAPAYPRIPPPRLPARSEWIKHFPVRYARPVRLVTAAVGLLAVVLLPFARFDYNPVNLRDPNTESVQAFEDLLARSRNSPWTLDVIAPDLATAQARARRLAELPTVERAITVADYVPADQETKLAILEDVALLLPPVRSDGASPDTATQRAALERLAAALEDLPRESAGTALAASARRLGDALQRFLAGPAAAADPGPALALLQANLVGSLPEQLGDLESALRAEPVTQADLPPEFVQQMISADGQARIQLYPREDLSDPVALQRFVDEVRALEPEVTGSAAQLVGWGRVTVGALRQALLAAMVCGALFLLALWRRGWDTLLAFFPLALAAVVACATMVLVGMPFNFANVIVLPMVLGMGIDSGVHLVHRHRTNPEEVDVLGTSTARAVFFSALATVASFASLAFAPHRGMAAVGKLLTLGVLTTLLCYLVVLPAVLEWDDRRGKPK